MTIPWCRCPEWHPGIRRSWANCGRRYCRRARRLTVRVLLVMLIAMRKRALWRGRDCARRCWRIHRRPGARWRAHVMRLRNANSSTPCNGKGI